MSNHHSSSVSSAGSNKFFNNTHFVGIGDDGPKKPCVIMINSLFSSSLVLIFTALCVKVAVGIAPIVVASPPANFCISSALFAASIFAYVAVSSICPPTRSSSSSSPPPPPPTSPPPLLSLFLFLLSFFAPPCPAATDIFKACPTSSNPFNCETASMACDHSRYCTIPCPFDCPFPSLEISIASNAPNGSNTAFTSSSAKPSCKPATKSAHGPLCCVPSPFPRFPFPVTPFAACSASQAMFFSASECFTITFCPLNVSPVSSNAFGMDDLS
mmetsp:Transcript_7207/g.22448  ORF Transcript_7207/g.22448 Transcript_7207/m.22448 type:complete len:271 (-) Transcript_7207:950-1762(-)